MEELIAEWVRLKVTLARTDKSPMERCGTVTRTPVEIADPFRTIEATEVKTCGERWYTCPACCEKMTAAELERRRATAKAARLWKKILKEYP